MMIGSILQDVRYGVRQLRRSPGFTATVVGVLALGIGANAAMFTVLNGTLLRRLPYQDAGSLVSLQALGKTKVNTNNTLADIEQWQARSRTMAGIAYYQRADAAIASEAGEQDVAKLTVSANLFSLLGVQPELGRGFSLEEQGAGKGDVVVLSDAMWRGVFGAKKDVIGKVARIDDVPAMVVGVMGKEFSFPIQQDASRLPQIWMPAVVTAKQRARSYDAGFYEVVGRMRPGVSEKAATAELSGLQAGNKTLYVDEMSGDAAPEQVQAVGYRASLFREQRAALLALMSAVGVVWLIACANVANLMLARSTVRRREMAVRGALGASQWRLVRQMMVESLLLSAAGSGLGIGLAWATLVGFHNVLATQMPGVGSAPDGRVLLALLGLSVLSAMVFGVAPAVIGARAPLDQTLRAGGAQAGTARGQHRVQQVLVMAEVGLSLALLVACGLLLRTVFALRHVPLGFRTDHVYVVSPKLPGYKYRARDANDAVYKPLVDRVKAMHGVEAAAITTVTPLSEGMHVNLMLNLEKGEGKDKKTGPPVIATFKAAGPELQKVLGFQMVKGRFFNDGDTADSPKVLVVNEAFAKKYEPILGPVEGFSLGDKEKGQEAKIVGVVKDFHQAGIGRDPMPEIDLCTPQVKAGDGFYQPTVGVTVQLAVRTSQDASGFLPDLQRVMGEVDPDLRASEVRTMDQVVEDAMGSQLLAAHLLETLGGLAVVVALAGLYSLLAYLVTLRTRELGVRMALGAAREDILLLVMGQAGWMLVGGLVLGLAISLGTTRLLGHFLFGVKARDGLTLMAAAVVMAVVGGVAAYLPARRAAGIEPMEALRTE